MPPSPSKQEVTHAYRHLLRAGLHAVQYSKPARYVIRDRLRYAFRHHPPGHFNAARVNRTLEFLEGAAGSKGLEHRVVKALVHVWWERGKGMGMWSPTTERLEWKKRAYREFDRTVWMLEESMGVGLGGSAWEPKKSSHALEAMRV
ncbi:uncharacterized protein LTR77_006559 [Saxophila tyrrhenica]|uniref:DUF1763-domain-containing protein n=1 Tax=Saxophila tyrrhenica TaxID=1690608 RepID=A0AAV9P574_9PEZI|nr:hypothetical protein LTR77_006559 [Saxophila tyrrhenica]